MVIVLNRYQDVETGLGRLVFEPQLQLGLELTIGLDVGVFASLEVVNIVVSPFEVKEYSFVPAQTFVFAVVPDVQVVRQLSVERLLAKTD